jgi:protein involved in polysaccharide export with SLBB domain
MSSTIRRLRLWCSVLVPVLLLTTGCTGLFGPNTQGQRLLPVTQELRSASPEPAPLPRELNKAVAPPYVVEPGDILLVQPASLDSPARLPGDQPVLPDGTINLGRYGRLLVAGKTVEQIEPEVKAQVEAITKDAGPVTVRIVSRQSKVFYVLGEVNAPGAYPLSGRETVLDAIMAGGGVNTRASLRGITLSRPTPPEGCRIVLPICYEEIVQLGDTSTNYQIANGDRIFVPAKGFWENLCGPSKKPQCPPCGRPQTACTALYGHGVECSAFWNSCTPAATPHYATPAPPAPPPALRVRAVEAAGSLPDPPVQPPSPGEK